jgi:hypothetical protein
MGGWGIFDDDNDSVADRWITIEEKIMPKEFRELMNKMNVDYELYKPIMDDYIKRNKKKLYLEINKDINEIKKYINKLKKEKKNEYERDILFAYQNIAGIILTSIKFLEEFEKSNVLKATSKKKTNQPKKVPDDYPAKILKEGANAVEILKEDVKPNLMGWFYKNNTMKDRMNALNYELKLFTKK